jgi:hypothetical protein
MKVGFAGFCADGAKHSQRAKLVGSSHTCIVKCGDSNEFMSAHFDL